MPYSFQSNAAHKYAKGRRRDFRAIGLSLVEILISVAVLGIILAVATPSLAELIERRRVIAAANQISTMINDLRALQGSTQLGDSAAIQFSADNGVTCLQAGHIVPDIMGACKCSALASDTCHQVASNQNIRSSISFPSSSGIVLDVDAMSFSNLPSLPTKAGDLNIRTGGSGSLDPALSDTTIRIGVSGRYHLKLQVELNPSGRLRICAPSGHSMTGYSLCD